MSRRRLDSFDPRQTLPELKVTGPQPPSSRPPRPADLSAVLVVLTGPQIGERAELGARTTVGRDPGSHLVLRDGAVSWAHCVVHREGEHYVVLDLGSRHGTLLNGQRVEGPSRLRPDDQLVVGHTLLRFELQGPAEQAFNREVLERLVRDDLTGLYTRRKFEIELEGLVEQAGREASPFCLVVLDLDGLKAVNDAHGHLAGARVIAEAGRTIARTLPTYAFACRYGGDEFAVGLPRMDVHGGRALALAIVAAIDAQRVVHEGAELAVRISAGLSVVPEDATDPIELFRVADEALFRAKKKGGGRLETNRL